MPSAPRTSLARASLNALRRTGRGRRGGFTRHWRRRRRRDRRDRLLIHQVGDRAHCGQQHLPNGPLARRLQIGLSPDIGGLLALHEEAPAGVEAGLRLDDQAQADVGLDAAREVVVFWLGEVLGQDTRYEHRRRLGACGRNVAKSRRGQLGRQQPGQRAVRRFVTQYLGDLRGVAVLPDAAFGPVRAVVRESVRDHDGAPFAAMAVGRHAGPQRRLQGHVRRHAGARGHECREAVQNAGAASPCEATISGKHGRTTVDERRSCPVMAEIGQRSPGRHAGRSRSAPGPPGAGPGAKRAISMAPESPMDVQLFDSTLRDGTQSEGLSLSVDDKLKIARLLDGFGIQFIEGGYPGSNPKDVEFFQRAKSVTFRNAKLRAFGMTRKAGGRADSDPILAAMLAAATPAATVVGKTWTIHDTKIVGTTLEENLAMIGESVAFLKMAGREGVYDCEHFFDGFRADRAYALATVKAAADAGADWIVMCDTNGGSLPSYVSEVVRAVGQTVPTRLGIHTHNAAELAVANALAPVAAVEKLPASYEHIPPERVGNRRHIVVSELAGRGIVRMRAGELGLDVQGNEKRLLEHE